MLFPVFLIVVGFILIAEDKKIQRDFGKYLNWFLTSKVVQNTYFKFINISSPALKPYFELSPALISSTYFVGLLLG